MFEKVITWISLTHPYPYFINTTVLETALWENFWETTKQTKRINGSLCTHLSTLVLTTLPETKQRAYFPSNNQIVKRIHICEDTQLKMPNPLVTAAPPNAELINNLHTSGVSLCNWTDLLWFFRFYLFSCCIINCHKTICHPLEKMGNSNRKIKREKLFMLFGKIKYER